jgi:hypothetical protein
VVAYARSRKVRALTADVLVGNSAMLKLFRSSGLPMTAHTSHGVTEVELTL